MPAARLTRSPGRGLGLLAGLLAVFAAVAPLSVAPAHAASRVSIDNGQGAAAIDSTYSTTLKVSGSGFQSIRGGHGGIYVWFGTVKGTWRPSQGGVSGSNYLYVPDTEDKSNQGFQRYIAFPGSATAGSANGTMAGNGSWSAEITVPGPTFKAVGRNGNVQTVDCRTVTCGVITVGAHGVKNPNNETFTPVAVRELYGASGAPSAGAQTGEQGATSPPTSPGSATPDPAAGAGDAPAGGQPTAPVSPATPKLEVDRASAVAGNALAFSASGLTPGEQYSAVFDDGLAAAGPFQATSTGQLTGVVSLPADVPAGTHELRLFGNTEGPAVKFAVRAAEAETEVAASAEEDGPRWPVIFAIGAGLVLLIALLRLVLLLRGRRPTQGGSRDET